MADLYNTRGRPGRSCAAASFLKVFAYGIKIEDGRNAETTMNWTHFDIDFIEYMQVSRIFPRQALGYYLLWQQTQLAAAAQAARRDKNEEDRYSQTVAKINWTYDKGRKADFIHGTIQVLNGGSVGKQRLRNDLCDDFGMKGLPVYFALGQNLTLLPFLQSFLSPIPLTLKTNEVITP
ncbi:hypothetical protein F5050DRAFT_1714309 [Lentinula boryana]|uniref:Uncharacterized protein n=1 Tax=Lentinula boryana TaxID=40481 RepID=A0ABQ8Q5A7_9AGAR|nr:hypothetical protein F5050DRAFT_1714309 [Lentinula boryana]